MMWVITMSRLAMGVCTNTNQLHTTLVSGVMKEITQFMKKSEKLYDKFKILHDVCVL